MAFENFPYSNFHELNLDWILEKVKEAYSASNPPDYPVKSVNGMTGDVIIAIPANLVQSVNGETGDVILYRNPLIQFPTTDESRWNLFRICDGDARGIEFDEDGAHRIEGTRRILIYDEENQPDYPVTSVNGQTGDVRITAGVNSVNGKTGNVVTPFVNPNTDILKLDSNSNTVVWGISRDVAGGNVALYISRGTGTPQAFIRYTPDQGEAVNLPLLSSADIPESGGVISVNTKTGVVTLYGTDILLNDTSANNIAELITTNSEHIQQVTDALFTEEAGVEAEWYRGDYNPATGEGRSATRAIRMRNYIDNNCAFVRGINEAVSFLQAWNDNDEYIGLYNPETNTFAPEEFYNVAYPRKELNITAIRKSFPGYKLKVVSKFENSAAMYTRDAVNIIFYTADTTGTDPSEQIAELQASDATQNEQISALQEANLTQDQRISSVESKNSTQDQQIAALQAADSTHAQQISELQSNDATHNQQISALQTSQATQDQQISELYTRTGIYTIYIENVNSLPLRYPASGTDAKIKNTNMVVSMDMNIPGAQTSDWTITTYDGYLEITGSISGVATLTLYLA